MNGISVTLEWIRIVLHEVYIHTYMYTCVHICMYQKVIRIEHDMAHCRLLDICYDKCWLIDC